MIHPSIDPADLDYVVARTGHHRFRDLVTPGNPAYREEFVPWIAQEAARLRADPGPDAIVSADRDAAAGTALPATGRALWAELHTRARTFAGDAAAERAWLADFARRVPCGECRPEWARLVAERPPELADAASYFAWTVWAHNRVNRKLGKPVVGVEEAWRTWSDPIRGE